MSFHVGQKVVCVNDGRIKQCGYGDEVYPKKGCVYAVRELTVIDDIECLCLREIRNVPRVYAQGFREMMFASFRFRPIQERSTETGMAILRLLLNPVKTTVSCVEQQEQHGTHSLTASVSA